MSRVDPWLTELASRASPALLETLPEASFTMLERRFLALAALAADPAVAAAAVKFLGAFPVRAREQLSAAAAAVGVVWVHRADAASLAKLRPPPTTKAPLARWHRATVQALASARGPRDPKLDAEPLLREFGDGPSTRVHERAVRLLALAPEARVADAAAAFLARPSVRWSAELPAFTALALLLAVHGNRAHLPAAKSLATKLPALAWVVRAVPARSEPAKPSPVGRAEQLLQAIAQAPGDDGPRAVLADWLLERGDPRGEFMQLQRTGADPKRAAALFKKHHRHWLGSLARGAVKGSVVFRDGVVRAVAIAAWKPADVPLADAPELATLEALTLDGGTDLPLPELLSSAARFPSLKSLAARPWVLAGADVALLDRLERLQVIAPRLGDARPPFAALERAELPALKVLHLAGSSWSEPSAVARLPQLHRLSELVVETRHPERWQGLPARVRLLEPS